MVPRPLLPLSAFDAEIGELVASNPEQMTFLEYRHVKNCLLARGPCRLLVFGVGLDSGLWTRINRGGTTLFLEDSENWIRAVRERHAGQSLAIQSVAYTTRLKDWENHLHSPEELGPPPILDRAWDVILVDGPMGWDPEDHPGRMQSIFWAARLAGHVRNHPTIVLVHDFHRVAEQMASWRFLGRSCLVGTIEHLAHFCIPHRRLMRLPWRPRSTLGRADLQHFSTELAKLKARIEGRDINA